MGIWHLTDSVENARAQPSLNGVEIPVSIRIDDSLYVGAEYAWYDLSTFALPESGIDISYPGSTGKARLEQSFSILQHLPLLIYFVLQQIHHYIQSKGIEAIYFLETNLKI